MDIGVHFKEYIPKSEATQPVTNLSPHVDGGRGGSQDRNMAASADEAQILHIAVAIVVVSLALLWLLGGLAFRSARL